MASGLKLYERAQAEFTLENGAGVQSIPRLTWISATRYVLVFTHDPAPGGVSDPEIRAQIFEADGTAVTGAFKVNSSDAGAQTNAVVARLAGGGFVVAWEDRNPGADGSGSAIRFQAYSADGNPSGGEHLANTTAAFDQSLP